MPEQLWFTHLLNSAFAAPVDAVMRLLHVPPAEAAAPITNAIAMEILVALILMGFAAWLSRRLSVENPQGWQHLVEMAWTWLHDHSEEVIGHGGARFLNYLFSLLLFIFLGNILGLIPGFDSPTASISVTVGLALTAFAYYNTVGVRKHGVGRYAKTFLGPVGWMAPLMVIIEIISHFARILSLSVRLYANMYAGELITTIFLALIPVAGIVFMGLHLFVAVLQTYIFVVLTMVYLSGALAEDH